MRHARKSRISGPFTPCECDVCTALVGIVARAMRPEGESPAVERIREAVEAAANGKNGKIEIKDLDSRLRGLVLLKRTYERDERSANPTGNEFLLDDTEKATQRGIVQGLQMAIDTLSKQEGISIDDPVPRAARSQAKPARSAGRRLSPPETAGAASVGGEDSRGVRDRGPEEFRPGSGEYKVLVAVAQQRNGIAARDQLSVMTGYKKSTRDTYLFRLRKAGLIAGEGGDRPIVVTEEGRARLGPKFKPLPTGKALREHWLATLPGGEREVFAHLVEAHPDPIDRHALDSVCGFAKSTRDTYLHRLIKRRLVVSVGKGEVCAAKELFS